MSATILVVDDDPRLRPRLVKALARRGFDARGAADGAEAVALARAAPPDRIVLDLRLPDASGLDLIDRLKAVAPQAAIVMLTGYGSIATTVDAMRRGAVNFVPKPADADAILAAFDGPQPADVDHTPSLARAEWEHIQRVLADCGGSVSEAARRLGLHRRTLQRKLYKDPPRE